MPGLESRPPAILGVEPRHLALLGREAIRGESNRRPTVFKWPGRRPRIVARALASLAARVEPDVAVAAALGDPGGVEEVRRAVRGRVLFDPFAGSGAIPVEAASLGYRAVGYDINPYAVLVATGLAGLCSGACRRRVSCLWSALSRAWRRVRGLWCLGGECLVHVLLARCPPCRAPLWVSSRRGSRGPSRVLVLRSDGGLEWRSSREGLGHREPSLELPGWLPEEAPGFRAYAVETYAPGRGRRWVSLLTPEGGVWRRFLEETRGAAEALLSGSGDVEIPYGEETRRLYIAGITRASQLFPARTSASIRAFLLEAPECWREAVDLAATTAPTLSLLAIYYQPLAKVNPGMVVKSYWIPRNPVILNPFSNDSMPGDPGPASKPVGRGTLFSAVKAYEAACGARSGCPSPPVFRVADSTRDPPPPRVDVVATDPPYPGLHTYLDMSVFYAYSMALAGKPAPGLEGEEIDTRDPEAYVESMTRALANTLKSLTREGLLLLLLSATSPENLAAIAGVVGRATGTLGLRLQGVYPLPTEQPGRLGRARNRLGFIIALARRDPPGDPLEPLSWASRVARWAGLNPEEAEYGERVAGALRALLQLTL